MTDIEVQRKRVKQAIIQAFFHLRMEEGKLDPAALLGGLEDMIEWVKTGGQGDDTVYVLELGAADSTK